MGLVSLKSNLAINGTPERYDTQGKLGDLPPGASQLDFDGALPAPVDNFTNDHVKGFTIQNPVGVTQFIDDGQTSIYGPAPGVPTKYDTAGILGSLPSNASQLDFDGPLPPPVDNFLNINANGFTLRNPVGVTQFTGLNGNTYVNPSGLNALSAVDYFTNIHAKGFTIKNSWGDSQFNGINGTQFINPSGKNLINSTPEDFGVDYLSNEPQKNFIIKQPKNKSNFTGISDDGYGTTYSFVTPLNRLRVTNWFPNETAGATGFKDRIAPYESGFIGISADSTKYQYPDTVAGARLLNVRLGQGAGTAKLENQLGNGSKMGNTGFYAENRYGEAVRNADNQSLLASWALRRRSPSPLEQQYAKFKLRDEAFNPTFIGHPLILRGLQNPDVLGPQRWGIDALGQQEGRTAANNLAAALDGGFIRGGASTALERSAIDTARLAKFMASPKGLVWAITQVGLGKSNPLVEKNPENVLPFNDTRSHSGLSTLLSVPGTAFGSHFTRHGIPFLNEAASYEKVIQYQTKNSNENINSNRLLKLKKELLTSAGGAPSTNTIAKLQKLSSLVKGNDNPIIQTLSGLGGPGSVYGLGSTTIRRYAHSREFGITFNTDDDTTKTLVGNSRTPYSDSEGNLTMDYYAGLLKTPTGHLGNPKISGDARGRDRDAFGIDDLGRDINDNPHNLTTWLGQAVVDGIEPGSNYSEGKSLKVQNSAWPANLTDREHPHSTMPYNEIREIAKNRNARTTLYNDFRTKISPASTPTGQKTLFSTDPKIANYEENNLSKRYGFGEQGKPDVDRTDPYTNKDLSGASGGNIDNTISDLKTSNNGKENRFALANNKNFRGDKINAIDYGTKVAEADLYDKERDFVKFYFSGIDLYDGGSDHAIVFRSSIKGLSDSFSPSWSPVSIIGRPDGPAIYSSFERNISFNFTVAATAREELVPMWRKLNYLATYTMPVYGAGKPGGALCRMTIGDMFVNTPGYFTGLTITVNDESSWDLADDLSTETSATYKKNKYAKQLPNVVDVDVQYKIIHDWRPQQGGRAYHLYKGNYTSATQEGSWLWDSNI